MFITPFLVSLFFSTKLSPFKAIVFNKEDQISSEIYEIIASKRDRDNWKAIIFGRVISLLQFWRNMKNI